ncbi:MAG: VWA domain-containing protein [Bryobacterales bacterium]|nr:VWA domain-containing protein [Bryobacterales bacterium]
MRGSIRIVLFLAALTAAFALLGQNSEPAAREPEASPEQTIRVEVEEVIVPVTVTDDKGRFVSDLDAKDFRIFDEGRPQQIRFFTRDPQQPVVVGFLLDMSNSTRIHWKHFQEASMELAFNLLPGDDRFSGYLITFANDAELAVNTTQDSEKIADKIRKLKPGGGAAFYDAIYMACTTRSLIQGEPYEPRRVIIVIGDGHDTASKKSLEEVLELAQRNLVTIYALSTVSFGFSSEGEKNLTRLAEETGGRVMYPLNNLYKDISGYLSTPSDEGNFAIKVGTGGYAAEVASGIFRAIAAVSGEISTQYILRYVPDTGTSPDSKLFRKIEVKVPVLPHVRMRHRSGYYPSQPQ